MARPPGQRGVLPIALGRRVWSGAIMRLGSRRLVLLVVALVAAAAGVVVAQPVTATYTDPPVIYLNDVTLVDAIDVYVDGALVAGGLAWGEHTPPGSISPAAFHEPELFDAIASPPSTSAARSDTPLTPSMFVGQDEPGSFDHPTVPTVIRFIVSSGDRWNVNEHDLLDDWICDPDFGGAVFQYGADVAVTDGYSGGSSTNGFSTTSRKAVDGTVRRVVLQGSQTSVDRFEPFAFGTFDLGEVTLRTGTVHAYIAYGNEGQYGVLGMRLACDTGEFSAVFDVERNPVYPSSRFVPVDPVRLFDTREQPDPFGPIADESSIDVQVTGRVGIPENGVSAVVLNVTATDTTAPGFVTVSTNG